MNDGYHQSASSLDPGLVLNTFFFKNGYGLSSVDGTSRQNVAYVSRNACVDGI